MTEPQKDIESGAQAPVTQPAESAAPEAVAQEPAAPDAVVPEPVAPEDPAPEPAARTGGRRKTVALAAAAVATAALVGAGFWASSAVAGADRSAPTAYWVPDGASLPDRPVPGQVPGNALSSKLIPAPPGYRPGPDLASDGNDYAVSGERALEGFKEARTGLSASERKKRDDMLAQLKLKGVAGRTFAKDTGTLVVEVQLMQADPKALDSFSQVSGKLLEFAGDGREAPKVDGYPDARCALAAVADEEKDKKDKKDEGIDSLSCVAVQGDVMVEFQAYGPKNVFSGSDAAAIFKNQLNHLKSPGESV
ncbi:hypothetical protein GCM10010302_45250 [Streptomyces polychromogenes]|uniref:Secreted protein n=1 Tax=Streptomyces polychromogenes TaxID=67342 RepID=A0ABP3F725_9ACTN